MNRVFVFTLIVLGVIFSVIISVVLFDDDDPETDAAPETTTTTVYEPQRQFDNSLVVGEDDRVLRAAIEAMRDLRPEDEDWYVGVILEEYEHSMRVAARNGTDEVAIVVVSEATCEDLDPVDLSVMVSPGDIITWSPEGEDQAVCGGEIDLLVIDAVNV